jgi:hypothetical protein
MDLMVGVDIPSAGITQKKLFPMIKTAEVKIKRVKTNKYNLKGRKLRHK